jgi:hypothetical protein
LATVQYTMDVVTNQQYPTGVKVVKWILAASDDGVPYYAPQYSGKAVQGVSGTGVVTWQGTLVPEGTSPVWATLHDPASADCVTTSPEIRQILEDCYAVRPLVDATGAATVYLFVTSTARR